MAAAAGTPIDFESLPLEPPPDGVLPNFQNPDNRSHELFIVAGLCLCIILSFACLRVYAKVYLLKSRGKDDYAYIVSLAAAITIITLYIVVVTGPVYGRHAWDVLIKDLSVGKIQQSLTIEMIYGPSIWMIKLSLFLLYLEIFGRLHWLRLLVYYGILVTGLVYLGIMIAMAAYCAPKNGYTKFDYLSAIAADKCARNDYLNTWPGLFNILSDFYLLILPLPAVWGLQLPTRKKIGVCAMFLTGFVACVCSILSLVYRLILRDNHGDNNWYFIPLGIVNIAEVTAGVIIPSVPSISVVYRHFQPAIHGYSTGVGQKLKKVLSSRSTETQKTMDSLEMGIRSESYQRLHV